MIKDENGPKNDVSVVKSDPYLTFYDSLNCSKSNFLKSDPGHFDMCS